MKSPSPIPAEITSNPHRAALMASATLRNRLQNDIEQTELARLTGIEKTKVNRLCKDIEPFMLLLHYIGKKMVDLDKQCFDADEIELMFKAYKRQVGQAETAADYFGLQQ